jgi:hypothetical protein
MGDIKGADVSHGTKTKTAGVDVFENKLTVGLYEWDNDDYQVYEIVDLKGSIRSSNVLDHLDNVLNHHKPQSVAISSSYAAQLAIDYVYRHQGKHFYAVKIGSFEDDQLITPVGKCQGVFVNSRVAQNHLSAETPDDLLLLAYAAKYLEQNWAELAFDDNDLQKLEEAEATSEQFVESVKLDDHTRDAADYANIKLSQLSIADMKDLVSTITQASSTPALDAVFNELVRRAERVDKLPNIQNIPTSDLIAETSRRIQVLNESIAKAADAVVHLALDSDVISMTPGTMINYNPESQKWEAIRPGE